MKTYKDELPEGKACDSFIIPTSLYMIFLVSLWVYIHPGQAEKYAWR